MGAGAKLAAVAEQPYVKEKERILLAVQAT
jgi:hypothetical protein